MDYVAAYGWMITEEELQKMPGVWDAITKFKEALNKEGFDLKDWAETDYGESDTTVDPILANEFLYLYEHIIEEFQKENGGLTLALRYHNSEADGSSYDDVDGVFWTVHGLHQLTPDGERLMKKHKVQHVSWVYYG